MEEKNLIVFQSPTAIIFSLDGEQSSSKLIRISRRSTDLRKVALVNSISRAITNQELTLDEAYKQLKELEGRNVSYPIWVQLLAAFLSSGCFTIMFAGQWNDFIWSGLAGGLEIACLLFIRSNPRGEVLC